MDHPLSDTNPQPRLPIRNYRPILHRHPLSPNYLLKRSPKYLHCNFVDNFRSPSQQNSRLNISKALQRAKYLQKLHRLQPLVTYKQYLRLLKRHNQNIDTDGIMHTLYSKPLSIVKIIMKKFKCIKKFNVRFNILNSGCIKYAKQLKMLSIATKASSDSRFSNAIMQVLKKTGRRLKYLKKVSIETGESFQDRTIMRELLENFQKFQFLKEIHIRFQHLDLRKFDMLAPIDFNGINKGLIASLHSIPHPTLLANILNECALFKQLKQLTFKLPLPDVQRYQNFDFKILEKLSRFENLQILGITLELCDTYNDLFVDHIRFPQSLRKLNFEVERLDFRRLYEGKREDIKTFFNYYQVLQIEDLTLNITINQHYLATYTEFIRPFLRTQQKTLKNLTMKFGFSLPTAKQKERKILHVSEVFEDINLLKSLKSFEWNFEVLDFTPKTGTKPLEHINLLNAVVNVQEVLWQENTARKSFIEETLKYLGNCKSIKKLLLQNKGNKEPESLRRSLNALVQFTNLEKVHIDWNMDALKVENLCRYLDYVKKLTNVTFHFKQILLTRDDLDAIRNSLARNKALIEARISLLNGDVVKHGRDGTPYESGSNWPKK